MKIIIISVLCLVLLSSCCSQKDTVIRTDTTTVYIPYTVRDTLELHVIDSLWFAQDSILSIRIDTLWKKVYYKIHDTVRYTSIHTDTTYLTKEITNEYSFWDKIKLILITLGCAVIAYALLTLIRR